MFMYFMFYLYICIFIHICLMVNRGKMWIEKNVVLASLVFWIKILLSVTSKRNPCTDNELGKRGVHIFIRVLGYLWFHDLFLDMFKLGCTWEFDDLNQEDLGVE